MTDWRVLSSARRTSYCPVALLLRDDFTGGGAISPPQLWLERKVGAAWLPTGIAAVRTSGSIYGWPGLGRAIDPATAPAADVRVRIQLAHQIPLYRATVDGLEFTVPPYNDANPPTSSPVMPQLVLLEPGPSYPFTPAMRVLRGRVLDPGGRPVLDALVAADGTERAMTGPGGGFSLPLRWQAPSGGVTIDVTHPRSGMAASTSATLPADLAQSFDITVS